tara:strand:- start:351 stop:584 length:234 start_codon:yes stop_codon:yes gene_type:complete
LILPKIKEGEISHIGVFYIKEKNMKQQMRRTNIYLTLKQHDQVHKEADKRGITFSEMFRKIIDHYLEEKEHERKESG